MHIFLHIFHFVRALLGARRWAQNGYHLPRYLPKVALCVTVVWAFCLWELAPPRGYNASDVPLLLFALSLAPIAIYVIHIIGSGEDPPTEAPQDKGDVQGDARRDARSR